MRIRRLLAATAVLALAFGLAPSYASHSTSQNYTTGTTTGLSLLCDERCTGEPGVNIGGVNFAAEGEIPLSVTIADLTEGPVAYTVCQDFNGSLCGEADPVTGQRIEPRVTGCGSTVDLTTSTVAFRADVTTSVFIRIFDPTTSGCRGVATQGTVTMTFV